MRFSLEAEGPGVNDLASILVLATPDAIERIVFERLPDVLIDIHRRCYPRATSAETVDWVRAYVHAVLMRCELITSHGVSGTG